ncbi:UDP-glycosyltransferase 76F1 [Morella rubra]|uniref:UDP-glycosyltransferase 76F1 n=1 Tax=Morella rubra TaxID=262757 RepID=A0A6A1UJ83_9ROSI|nr:UDP-glycosyltransferase 76F1 [Morella rubra]
MTWLDSQPSKSVVYVSFGSLAMRTCDQLKELWHGLVNSGKPFLLVIRPDSIVGADGDYDIPVELKEGTKERGFLVDWAPQEDVLGHQAVGAYFTHCGWNSTLEAIVAGVPMICLAQYVDQHITSTLVTEVWKIGLDLKETCDRSAIEKVIRTLMDDKREEFIASVGKIAKLANKCVSQGGSSYKNLDKLIEDIRKI